MAPKIRGSRAIGQDGFTAVEVAIVLLLVGVISAIAVPTIIRWLPDYRLRAAGRELFSNFQLAKMTAVRTNGNVAVVFNQPVAGTTFDYVVFIDEDNDLEYDANEQIITSVNLSDHRGVQFDTTQGGGNGLTFPVNDNGLPAIAFRGNGLTSNNGGGFGAGTAFLRNTNGRTLRVVVNANGSIRIE